MQTKLLMSAAAGLMGALGLAASFLPQEILGWAGVPPVAPAVLVVQIAGALYLGFAMLDWMARGSVLGGIYGRPVVLGNFLHFAIVAIALVKALTRGHPAPALVVGTVVYLVLAVWFGGVLFTSPVSAAPRPGQPPAA